MREVGCAGRLAQSRQDLGASRADQAGEPRPLLGSVTEEGGSASSGVDQKRRLEHSRHLRRDERGRAQEESRRPKLGRCRSPLLHPKPASAQSRQGGQILKEPRETSLGETAGTIGNIAFEQLPQSEPCGLQKLAPEEAEQFREQARSVTRTKSS